ncbi:Protein of unknown function DM4/12, partial [Trinorchestia longiramus]
EYGFNLLDYAQETEEEKLLRTIRENDEVNCGLRLVCELSSIKDRPLLLEEWEILAFVWKGDELFNLVFPGQGIRSSSETLKDYKDAARVGARGSSCSSQFSTCPVDASFMMEEILRARRSY